MTKSSGFTLIELLVVVAIVGILSAVGIVSYNGYVDSTKKKATENILGTIGLAQTDHYASCATYYSSSGDYCESVDDETECSATSASTRKIGQELFGDPNYIDQNNGFLFCSFLTGRTSYTIKAVKGDCVLSINQLGKIDRSLCQWWQL